MGWRQGTWLIGQPHSHMEDGEEYNLSLKQWAWARCWQTDCLLEELVSKDVPQGSCSQVPWVEFRNINVVVKHVREGD